MDRLIRLAGVVLIAALCCFILPETVAPAQTTVSDKGAESTMKSLRDDARKFRASFNAAIAKSSIRKTSQEKDAKDLVARFERQIGGMQDRFKDRKKAELDLQSVLSTAEHIDTVFADVSLGEPMMSDWKKVRSDLTRLSDAFGIAGGPTQ